MGDGPTFTHHLVILSLGLLDFHTLITTLSISTQLVCNYTEINYGTDNKTVCATHLPYIDRTPLTRIKVFIRPFLGDFYLTAVEKRLSNKKTLSLETLYLQAVCFEHIKKRQLFGDKLLSRVPLSPPEYSSDRSRETRQLLNSYLFSQKIVLLRFTASARVILVGCHSLRT